MHLTKKLDRAFQWAGEKIGGEKTDHSDEFKTLEAEMIIRQDGMEKLQKSTTGYLKWISRRGESYDDKEKSYPVGFVGRMMATHGEAFEPNSEYGNSLIALGRANERLAEIQEGHVVDVSQNWVEALERSLAMMKEFQAARKKHESRRLAYDTSITKLQKAKREDFRLEDEMRASRAKFEESGEDVLRRMQDIRDAEPDSLRDLTAFLDAQLEYHERSAEELRQVRQNWTTNIAAASPVERTSPRPSRPERRLTGPSRTGTTRSAFSDYSQRNQAYEDADHAEAEPQPQPVRMPFRSHRSEGRFSATTSPVPDLPSRPSIARAQTFQTAPPPAPPVDRRGSTLGHVPSITALRGNQRPLGRLNTNKDDSNIFADDYDDNSTPSSTNSPNWGARSASPATSFGSLNRSTSNLHLVGGGARKAPPPPPPCRSKKPAPPIPPKRTTTEVSY